MKPIYVAIALLAAAAANGQTYYVSPTGNDLADGLTAATAWASLDKVSTTAFTPGSSILFERNGEWRGQLIATSSGTAAAPVTYGAYGQGAKPVFRGSDILNKSGFTPVGGTTYSIPQAANVGSVLANGNFLKNAWLVGGRTDNHAAHRAYVDNHVGSFYYNPVEQSLYLNVGTAPADDPRQITAVTRDDVVWALNSDFVVFRDLVSDETAIYDRGYGFRSQGADNVLIENCEAYRAGKHHFGAINSDGFIGRGLKSAYAMPDQGVGGMTALVSFSDQFHPHQFYTWEDCEIRDLGNFNYPAWISHGLGDGIGGITLKNIRSYGHDLIIGNFTTAADIYVENAAMRVTEATVNGALVVGADSTIAFGSNALVANAVIDGYYWTRFGAAPLIAGGHGNRLVDSTVRTGAGFVETMVQFPGGNATLEMDRVVLTVPAGNPVPLIGQPGSGTATLTGDWNVFDNIAFTQTWATPPMSFEQWKGLNGGHAHSVIASSSADFDRNGVVDSADFLTWQRGAGIVLHAGHFHGDADWDGDVDAQDFAAWVTGFAGSTANIAAIPEPSGIVLASIVLLSQLLTNAAAATKFLY